MNADVVMDDASRDVVDAHVDSSSLTVPAALINSHEEASREAETRSYSVDEMVVDLASDMLDEQGNALPREADTVVSAVRAFMSTFA